MQEAEQKLNGAFVAMPRNNDAPQLLVGCIPVFWQDFAVDPSDPRVRESVAKFSLTVPPEYRQPKYNFNGLERVVYDPRSTVQAHRDGLVVLHRRIELRALDGGLERFFPVAIDRFLRLFLGRVVDVHVAARLVGPYLVGMMLRIESPLTAAYGGYLPGLYDDAGSVPAGNYSFPVVQANDLSQIDRVIRPLCDQAHQMFGRESSPYFNRHTLGQLLKSLNNRAQSLDALDALLVKARDERNRLSHSFYREHNFRRNSEEGRAFMMEDLEVIHSALLDAYKTVLALSGVDLDALANAGMKLPTRHVPI